MGSGFSKKGEATKYDRRPDEVGFSVYALVVGLEAEVRLLEVLDFVLGIFTIDPMKDDRLRKPPTAGTSSGTRSPAVKKPLQKKAPPKAPVRKKPPARKKTP